MQREIKNFKNEREMWDEIERWSFERAINPKYEIGSAQWRAEGEEMWNWYKTTYPQFAWTFEVEGIQYDKEGNIVEIIPLSDEMKKLLEED